MNERQLKIYDDNILKTIRMLGVINQGAIPELIEHNLSFIKMLSSHGVRISYNWEETN